MPNYTPTGPFSNGGAPGISANFLNNIENVFKQPSGGTETGTYYIEFGAWQSGATDGCWQPSLSRGRTPVSVSIDTSITSSQVGSTTVQFSNANGFFAITSSTGPTNTSRAAGNYTINY